ncbi:MAG: hypothetical protein LBP59_06475 [Planctomycetaceae bacterium]|jgi:hypothetical protein|nr:hypothetical protein [Planctomycetaceae bacterium]
MSNWLTITWEANRLRFLLARMQGGSAIFEHAGQFTLQKNDGGMPVKEQLIQFLQKNRLGKTDTIVLLNRSDVEVRPMVFPPVPSDELCDLVRFQAVKEFNAYDQTSPLDFFVTNKFDNISRSALFPSVFNSSGRGGVGVGGGNRAIVAGESKSISSASAPVHLLASTIRRELFQKINKFCEESGLNLRRILLRPCESAYLWKFAGGFNLTRTVLLLELDVDETSQTVLYQGEPVFIRSPKISPPSDVTNPDFVALLAAELRRTMIAVRNEIQGVTVDNVVICGSGGQFIELANLLAETLGTQVIMFDAWVDPKYSALRSRGANIDLVKMSDKLRDDFAAGKILNPERYTALIGATLRAGRNIQGDIDFCNPKRRQEKIGYRFFVNLAIVVIFLLLAVWVGYGFYTRNLLVNTNRALSAKRNELEQKSKAIVPLRLQLQAIESWHDDKIDWFEQLGWLSRNAPEAKDMMLKTLTLDATSKSMSFTSLLRNSSIVSPMEEKFRSDNHDVKTGDKSEIRDNKYYRYQVTLGVFLTKSEWNLAPVAEEPVVETQNKDLPPADKNSNNNSNPNATNNSTTKNPEPKKISQPKPTIPPTPANTTNTTPPPSITTTPSITTQDQFIAQPQPPQIENIDDENYNENENDSYEEDDPAY